MSIFNINWYNVVENLTPSFWRKTKANIEARLIAYLRSVIAPMQELSDILRIFQYQTMLFLDYCGQHLSLENLLNDNWDNEQRRIYITENNIVNGYIYIDLYLQPETDPSPISVYLQDEGGGIPFSLYLQGEVIGATYNFTINVPVTVLYDIDEMTKKTKNYSEAAKTFNIITF
jgi:hypothetical protein